MYNAIHYLFIDASNYFACERGNCFCCSELRFRNIFIRTIHTAGSHTHTLTSFWMCEVAAPFLQQQQCCSLFASSSRTIYCLGGPTLVQQ